MIIILAKCNVDYKGRAESKLESGDRLIIIKKDGTFMIHQELNLDPVNWQAPGCKNIIEKDENYNITLKSIKRKPNEEIRVNLEEIYTVTHYNCEDTKDLEIRGREKHMVDLVWDNPNILEKGFRPTRREYPTDDGFIDMTGKDRDSNLVIIEFKSRKAGSNAVKQLNRYMDYFKDNKEPVRGILVAPSITHNATELLEEYNLEFVYIAPPKRLMRERRKTLDSYMKKD